MPALTPIIAALDRQEIFIIVSLLFLIIVTTPLIFVILAIRKSKKNQEPDYIPYHLMEPEDRLLMLQGLRTKELISEEDFEKKRKNILRELQDIDHPKTQNPPTQDTPPEPPTPPKG